MTWAVVLHWTYGHFPQIFVKTSSVSHLKRDISSLIQAQHVVHPTQPEIRKLFSAATRKISFFALRLVRNSNFATQFFGQSLHLASFQFGFSRENSALFSLRNLHRFISVSVISSSYFVSFHFVHLSSYHNFVTSRYDAGSVFDSKLLYRFACLLCAVLIDSYLYVSIILISLMISVIDCDLGGQTKGLVIDIDLRHDMMLSIRWFPLIHASMASKELTLGSRGKGGHTPQLRRLYDVVVEGDYLFILVIQRNGSPPLAVRRNVKHENSRISPVRDSRASLCLWNMGLGLSRCSASTWAYVSISKYLFPILDCVGNTSNPNIESNLWLQGIKTNSWQFCTKRIRSINHCLYIYSCKSSYKIRTCRWHELATNNLKRGHCVISSPHAGV